MPSQLERSQSRFRRNLLAQDASSRAAVRRSYQAAIRTLTADLRATLAAIEDLRARGEDVPLWRLLAENRARQLIARAEAELARYADVVAREVQQAQSAAIRQAEQDALRLIEESFGPPPPGAALPIHALPAGAIRELTAQLQPDAPVRRLLEGFAGDAVEPVQDAITGGIASGQSPYQITRAVTNILGSQARTRAERIVRTEAMRAYREASRATYVENKHLMEGWIWYSAMNTRTCAVCIALHGQVFKVETRMATHPNCRCVLMPKTKSWKDLGYDVPDNRPAVALGPDEFAKWHASDQMKVLGPQGFELYRAGDITLESLVGQTRSDVWGEGRRRVSLATARERTIRKQSSAAVDWKPTMTREEADVFTAQSVIKQLLWRGGRGDANRAIAAEGLGAIKQSAQGILGKGYYLTESKVYAEEYGEPIAMKADIRNPLAVGPFHKSGDDLRGWKMYERLHGKDDLFDVSDIPREKLDEWTQLSDRLLREHSGNVMAVRSQLAPEVWQFLGYDAAVYRDEDGTALEIIIWNPKKAVHVKDVNK